jgi:hypothetical protein
MRKADGVPAADNDCVPLSIYLSISERTSTGELSAKQQALPASLKRNPSGIFPRIPAFL